MSAEIIILWDETRKMNLAMRAKSEREAFLEALDYYQDRLREVECQHRELKHKVDAFLTSINPEYFCED